MKTVKLSSVFIVVILAFCSVARAQKININADSYTQQQAYLGGENTQANIFEDAVKVRQFNCNPALRSVTAGNEGDTLLLDFFVGKQYEAVIRQVTQSDDGVLGVTAQLTDTRAGYCFIAISDKGVTLITEAPEYDEQYAVAASAGKTWLAQNRLSDVRAKEIGTDYDPWALSINKALPQQQKALLLDAATDPNSPAVIDLMFVYTAKAADWAQTNATDIHNVINIAVQRANLAMSNSGTGVTFRIVHKHLTSYEEVNNTDDLDNLTTDGDGNMDDIHNLRVKYGADLVVMLADIEFTGGLGWVLSTAAGEPAYGFSLCRVKQSASNYTVVHEIGHNLGCGHNHEQTVQPGPGSLAEYASGWKGKTSGNNNVCTIMTYGESQYHTDGQTYTTIPYFSSPDITYEGTVIGDAQHADNARLIRETKHTVANYVSLPDNPVILDSIKLPDGIQLIPEYNPNIRTYDIRVPHDTPEITIDWALAQPDATVTIQRIYPASQAQAYSNAPVSNTVTLQPGSNTVEITVTSANSLTTQVYTLYINRAPASASSDASLSSLKMIVGNSTMSLNPNVVQQNVTVSNSVTTITLLGTATDPNAEVLNAENASLKTGFNYLYVTVVAEDGTIKKYTVTVFREYSTDANLKSITLSHGATLAPSFSPDRIAYTVEVKNTVTEIDIVVFPNHPNATVSSEYDYPLDVGANEIKITVTAEDGVTTKTYTITVIRALSDDATLKSLEVSPGALTPVFTPSLTDYVLNVNHSVTSISRIEGETAHEYAQCNGCVTSGIDIKVGDTLVKLLVTAENGTTTKQYTVRVHRYSDDAMLSGIGVSAGTLSPAFAPDVYEYYDYVPHSVDTVDVTGTTNHPLAKITDNVSRQAINVGDNVFTLAVTAEDGAPVLIYTVHIVRAPSSDATLKSITLSGDSVNFHPDLTLYNFTVPNRVTSISINGEKNCPDATVSGNEDNKALAVGDNHILLTVTAEDGTTTKTYTVVVHRMSADVTLKGVTLSAGTIANFAPNVTAYIVRIPNDAATISIVGETNHPDARAENITGESLALGDNILTLPVTAEDTTFTGVYTFTVRRLAADADLTGITPSEGSLSPTFAADLITYSLTMPNSVASLNFNCSKSDPNASLDIKVNTTVVTGAIPLLVGDNVVNLVVTAEDGTTLKTYTVTVHRLSNDATLKSLSSSHGTLSPAFLPSQTIYTVYVPHIVETTVITGEKNHSGAKVSGDGAKTLTVGDNTVTLTVTAEDGTTTETYTVTVRRLSNDADLTGITLSEGVLSPVFAPNITAYSMTVASSVTNLSLTGITKDPNAKVEPESSTTLDFGDNIVRLTVTAEDGTTKTYTVTIHRLSNDATLREITLSTGSLSPVFSPGNLAYAVNVPNDVVNISVNGTTNHSLAKLDGDGTFPLAVGNNTVSLVVTAEDGTTSTTYTVTVRRLSNDASFSALEPSAGALSPAFSPNLTIYADSVPNNVKFISITGTTTYLNTTVVVDNPNLNVGDNLISIVGAAEDGTTKTYTVNVVRAPSNDATLQNITLSSGLLTFQPATTEYTVNVANSVSAITVTGTPKHEAATVQGNWTNQPLNVGSNTVTLIVTAEDGTTTLTYTVNVVRAVSTDATLSGISLSAGVLSPAFKPEITEYRVEVSNNISSLTINGVHNHPSATVATNGTVQLAVGDNVVTLTVTAEDGATTKTYTLTIHRLSNDASLREATPSHGTLSPAFDPSITSYDIRVANSVTSISINGVPTHEKATVDSNEKGNVALKVGDNVVALVVTAEDGATRKAYTFTVRRLSNDATLSSLSPSAGTLSPVFTPENTTYRITVANDVTNIGLHGTPNYPQASAPPVTASLTVGDNTLSLVVTSEDGTVTKDYTVTVHRLSNNADLSGITLSSGTLSPAFAPDITAYSVNVAHNVTSVGITCTTAHKDAKTKITGDGLLLLESSNNASITVTAEDGVTKKTYSLTVHRLSNDANLNSITLSAGTLSPSFDPNTVEYTVTVGNSVTNISVIGLANNPQATVSGNVENKTLNEGDNVVTIAVTTEDGTQTKIYRVNVKRDSPSELVSVKVNGQSLPVSGVIEYAAECEETDVTLATEISTLSNLYVNGEHYDGQSIPFSGDLTDVNIRVQSISGKTTSSYILRVAAPVREDKLYYTYWDDVLALNKNPDNNNNVNIAEVRWFRKYSKGDNSVISTRNYISIATGTEKEYYAEIKMSATDSWHKVCGSIEPVSRAAIVAYPNPVRTGESLTLKLPQIFAGGKMNVYTIAGALVKADIPLPTSVANVNVSQFGTGIYLLNIVAPNGLREEVKIIIE